MPALAAQHIRKSFGPRVVLDDATFTLGRGQRVGLIGANGAGKSTLARILAGHESPDGGTVSVRRGLTVAYLAQEPELDPDASARSVVESALEAWRTATARHAELTAKLAERGGSAPDDSMLAEQAELGDAILRLGGWQRGHEALGFLDRLGVRDVDRPCGARSGGEQRRIALARLLVSSPDVAILDEPTNHIDADTATWLEDYLAHEFRGAVVLVTHDRYFLDVVAQSIVELERGRLTTFPGGYAAYVDKKADLVAHEDRVERNRQNALRREREWLSRGPKARTTKQKARIQRATELEARGPANAGRPGDVVLVATAASAQGKTILELRGVQVAPAPGVAPLHRPLDLVVGAGDRIGIIGPNGVGKTTLLQAMFAAAAASRLGVRPPVAPVVTAGRMVIGKNTRASYLDQARESLDDEKSIVDDVRGESGDAVALGGAGAREPIELQSYLERFLFDRHKQRQKVGSLSGGERARVALAKVLRSGANLLLFDEPTNDLDLPTLAALEEMLEGYEGSVLVVTHDRAFLDRVATGILAFEPDVADARVGGRSAPDAMGAVSVIRYAGGYHDYLAQRGATEPPRGAREVREAPRPEAAPPKGKGGLTYAERLELAGIIDAIEAAEREVADAETQLADPTLYATRWHEVPALEQRLRDARAEASTLLARWEALETKKAEHR